MSLTHNIKTLQGEDVSFTFRINHNGEALDLSQGKARLHIRKKASDEVLLLALDERDGIILAGFVGTVAVAGGKTEALPPGIYVYDLFVQLGTRRYVPVVGKFELLDAVTDTKDWA